MKTSNNTSTNYQSLNTDFEVRSLDARGSQEPSTARPWWYNFNYLVAGVLFGIFLVKAEVISWFRIQEMFRLRAFHMYGVIGSAVGVGILSVFLIKKFNIKTLGGEPITFYRKSYNKGNVYGGLLFGFGWALTGACPGPLFAQIGSGATVVVVTLLSAIAGTWMYGYLRDWLPH
jgi:uncharacterized membrane protein YedE/YeeE